MFQNKEIWKDIKCYEGRYQVSNLGRVKRLERTFIDKRGHRQHIKERILKPRLNNSGYLLVYLYDNRGKGKNFTVHRLVCEAFHENPENKPCVNHIDENKTNNTENNLEWSTYEENLNHGTHNARVSKAVAKALSKSVGQYTTEGELVKIWQSTIEIERQLGFSHGNISQAANGKLKTSHGYVWKYIEERYL